MVETGATDRRVASPGQTFSALRNIQINLRKATQCEAQGCGQGRDNEGARRSKCRAAEGTILAAPLSTSRPRDSSEPAPGETARSRGRWRGREERWRGREERWRGRE